MKVIIDIDWDNDQFESNIIDWPFEALPEKGDMINFDEEFPNTVWKYIDRQPDKEAMDIIQGNSFTYEYKTFIIKNGQPCIRLSFEP